MKKPRQANALWASNATCHTAGCLRLGRRCRRWVLCTRACAVASGAPAWKKMEGAHRLSVAAHAGCAHAPQTHNQRVGNPLSRLVRTWQSREQSAAQGSNGA